MTSQAHRSDRPPASIERGARLLTWCARATVRGESASSPPLEGMADADWAGFLRLGLAHAMLPLAWRALAAHSEHLPPLVTGDLREAFEANARRNLLLAGELRTVLAELAAARVEAVPWKGPLLAQRAYGDLSLRQFFDLDILVRRADLDTALATLAQLGFGLEKPMTPAQRHTYVDHQGELELIREADGLWLELHTAIVPTYYASGTTSEELWQRLVDARIGRTAVIALDPVDDLEGLCVHGSKHRWDRLAWIVDVALMARLLSDDDWHRFLAGAREHGTVRMAHIGLLLAVDLAGADVPAEVRRQARRDRGAARLAAQAAAELYEPRWRRFDGLVFHARMRERPGDRLRYLVKVLFTPSGADWESLRLPRRLFPLYAFTRPVRLGWKYGRRLLARSSPGE